VLITALFCAVGTLEHLDTPWIAVSHFVVGHVQEGKPLTLDNAQSLSGLAFAIGVGVYTRLTLDHDQSSALHGH